MVNQVSSKTSTLHSATTGIGQPQIGAPDTIRQPAVVDAVSSNRNNVFPEAAILSRQPLRYNVQLNQQLTAVQQADNYLAQTEDKLMKLRHSAKGGRDIKQVSSELMKHLNDRPQLSGGTVDRQFNLRLQQSSKVNFSLPGLDKLVENPQGETLVFSLGGSKREIAAVTLPRQEHPKQVLRQMNLGLGRLGIYAQQGADGKTTFSVDEERWGRVSEYLSVRGEGQSFPSESFTMLTPKAEASQEDVLQQILTASKKDNGNSLHNAMDNITKQRSRLNYHQGKAANRISDLAPPMSAQQAQSTSQALGNLLAKSGSSYDSFTQALSAQGNVRLGTVKNLLG